MVGQSFLTLAVSLMLLVLGGRYTIRLLANITRAFGISEFAIAFIFLAIATSVPELFVAVSSSLQNAGDLVLATTLGSNVINMSLILGLATITSAGISTAGLHLKRDLIFGGITTLLPILFIMNGVISRAEGIVLLALFSVYILLLYRQQPKEVAPAVPRSIVRGVVSIIGVLILIGVILFAADLTVTSSVSIAEHFQFPAFLIGIFLLALGTSLPELTTTLQSALMRRPTMALGTILGSNVADSALIIGIAATIRPLTIELSTPLYVTGTFIFLLLTMVGYFSVTKSRLSFSEGLILLLCFFLFGLILFLVGVPVTETV